MATLPNMPGSRYKYVKRRHHPLSTPSGQIPEHRIILYEKIGPGTHPCHWCGVPVTWMPGRGPRKGALVTDHLDGDKTNNRADNLVPSCQPCNGTRHRRIADDECFVVIEGKRHRAEWRTCEDCATRFKFRIADTRPNQGRFCSRSCRARATNRRRTHR